MEGFIEIRELFTKEKKGFLGVGTSLFGGEENVKGCCLESLGGILVRSDWNVCESQGERGII